MLRVEKVAVENRAGSTPIGDPRRWSARSPRQQIVTGAQITKAMFTTSGAGQPPVRSCRRAYRAQSVQVDQVTGVGTLIHVGDRVDAVVGFGAAAAAPSSRS